MTDSSTGQDARHENLASALVAALTELTVIATDQTANAGSYSYNYADIADVVRLTRPVLAEHGIVALTPIHEHGDGLACTVILLHTSGERMDLGPLPFPHGKDAQATGSMVTYHRRYALVAALGMATGQDDDGATAAPRQKQAPPLPPVLASEEQHNEMDEWRNLATDEDKAELNGWYKTQRLPRLEDLTIDQAQRVLARMKAIDKAAASEPSLPLETP